MEDSFDRELARMTVAYIEVHDGIVATRRERKAMVRYIHERYGIEYARSRQPRQTVSLAALRRAWRRHGRQR